MVWISPASMNSSTDSREILQSRSAWTARSRDKLLPAGDFTLENFGGAYCHGAHGVSSRLRRRRPKIEYPLGLDRLLVVVELPARHEFDVRAERNRLADAPSYRFGQCRVL